MLSQTEIRRSITDRILNGLKTGLVPWQRPWSSDPNCGSPKNATTGNLYRGINVLLLGLSSLQWGFTSRWWGTFNQWRKLGGQVKRRPHDVEPGHWGTSIVLYKPISRTTTNVNGEEEVECYRLLR